MPNFMTQFKTTLKIQWEMPTLLYFLYIFFTEQNIPSALCYFTKRANSFCSLLICSNPQDFLSIKKISILIVKCIMLQCLCLMNTWLSFSRPALANRTFFQVGNALQVHALCQYGSC